MKRFFFYGSLFIIPLLFLLLFEITLRLFGYGYDYSLLKRQGDYYLLNPNYPQKFFSGNDISIPEFIPQKIPVKKAPREKRIICLGGSTTEGFPYEVNINFPHFLQCYLNHTAPKFHWRLINLGLSAINSHCVRNMASEALNLQPDVVLIYMGHNEFYGALGLASVSVLSSNPDFVQFLLFLKNFRLYQLLENFVHLFQKKPHQRPATLMAAMIRKSHIEPNSAIFKKTVENFQVNLQRIVAIFSKHGIPVYVSTLSSNLKDQGPLGYPNPQSAIPHYHEIQQALNLKQYQKAKYLLTKALKADSTNPLTHYLLGKLAYQEANFIQAKRQFLLAKDLDRLPFRAPSQMNVVIRQICAHTSAILVPGDSMFCAHAPHGIPDSSLFLEHLHPNARGYQLLARSFFERLIPPFNSPRALARSCQNFTDLDRAIGELKILDLVSHPPFNGRTHFKIHTFKPDFIYSLAKDHVFGDLFWDAAHLKLGAYFQQHKQWEKALKEYSAILEADSLHFSALYRIGDVLVSQRKFNEAILYYQKAEAINPEAAFLKAKLARAFLLSGNERQALHVMNTILNDGHFISQLSAQQRGALIKMKSLALTKLGRTAGAQRLMERAKNEFAH